MSESAHDTTMLLLRAAQAGDGPATNQLFERYRDRLLQIVSLLLAKRRGGLLEDEEDIVQDTLLKAFQNLGSFTPRSQGSLLHWLAKLAENNLRDARRREQTEKRGAGRVRSPASLGSSLLISSIFPGREPSPSQVARGAELALQLESLLISLPESKRRVFVLRQLCNVGFDEIAAELGLGGAASARSLYSRTMTELSARFPGPDGP
jgi:RNA polymerase sigma factor (sigma-70 family)